VRRIFSIKSLLFARGTGLREKLPLLAEGVDVRLFPTIPAQLKSMGSAPRHEAVLCLQGNIPSIDQA
jgi:hypothetical protein